MVYTFCSITSMFVSYLRAQKKEDNTNRSVWGTIVGAGRWPRNQNHELFCDVILNKYLI